MLDDNLRPEFTRFTVNNWSNYFSFSEKTLTINTAMGQGSIFFVSVDCIGVSNGVMILSTTIYSTIFSGDNLDGYNLISPWRGGSTLTFKTNIISFRNGFRLR